MNTSNEIPKVGFLRLAQVLRVFPVSRSSWYQGVKAGRYPPVHKLSSRSAGWRAQDIRDLIELIEYESSEQRVLDGGVVNITSDELAA